MSKSKPEPLPPPSSAVEIPLAGALPNLQGETVTSERSRIGQINASVVESKNDIVGQVTAATISVKDSIFGVVHSKSLAANESLIGISSAETPNLQGVVGISISQQATLIDSRAGIIITREVKSDHIQSVIVIASNINGTVEVLADRRSMAVFGLVTGLVLGIVYSVFRLFRGR